MARRKKKVSTVYVISIGAHLAVGAILALVPQQKLRDIVAITLNQAPEKKKVVPPKPPEHHEARPVRSPGHNYHPALATVAPAAAPGAFADIGIALDSSSEDGVAVNMAPAPVAPAPVIAVARRERPKILVAHHAAEEDTCSEDIVKARVIGRAAPAYTDQARRAKIEGQIMVELMVDDQGNVTSARVLQGLGYGLDEAAVEAGKRFHFSPATRCGKAVGAPFIIRMRFALSQ